MNKKTMFIYGGFGSLVPDVLLLYSKRFTAPLLEFASWQVLAVTLFYAVTAGLVAQIFPYVGEKSKWKSFSVGVLLPIIISGLIGAGDRLSNAGAADLTTRGPEPTNTSTETPRVPGSVIDLIALF